jgi:hypothetical protein
MEFKDKINQSVAAAVAKIMGEALHPNQQKLDVHEPEKDKLTADDFKKLRAKKGMKKEEVEQIDELTGKGQLPAIKKAHADAASDASNKMNTVRSSNIVLPVPKEKTAKINALDSAKKYHAAQSTRAGALMKKAGIKEEVESIDEVKMADLPSTKVQGRAYGASKPEASAFDVLKGPKDKELKSIESEKKKKPVNEEDSELTLDDYLLEDLVEFVMSEEFQQLDELSKSTLGSYVTKASKDMRSHAQMAGSKDTALMAHQMGYRRGEKSPIKGGTKGEKRVSSEIAKHQTKANNRTAGIAGAAQRLAKEQFEITEEDAYDKNVKPSDKPHDKDAAKKRAQTSAVAARKVMSMSAYSASKKSE